MPLYMPPYMGTFLGIMLFFHFFEGKYALNGYNQQLKQIIATIFPIYKKELKG